MFIFLVETCSAFLSTENTHRRNRGAKLEVTAMEGLLSSAGCHGATWARKGSCGQKAKLGIFGVECIAFTDCKFQCLLFYPIFHSEAQPEVFGRSVIGLHVH